ncbi:hypothetical protein BH23CHL7_BH23CHL7_15740 [soil metagenome]
MLTGHYPYPPGSGLGLRILVGDPNRLNSDVPRPIRMAQVVALLGEPAEYAPFERAHRCLLVGSRMIPPARVERSVDDQQAQFVRH